MKHVLEILSHASWGVFRANDAYNTLRDHQFDHDIRKKEEGSGQNRNSEPGKDSTDEVVTKPEQWVKEKGTLGKIADRFFSPSFSKLLTLASIPLMVLFTPGVFGILGAVVAVIMLGYNATREVMSYRELKHLKEERGLLEAIEYYKGINEEHDRSVGIITSDPGKGVTSEQRVNEVTGGKKPSKLAALGDSLLNRAPESAVSIAAAAVSGNPVALGLAVGGAITGYGATASQTFAYEKMRHQLINHNRDIASRAGITYNNRDELVGELNRQLNKFRKNNPELAHHVQGHVSLVQEPSFFSDATMIFRDGFSWSKNCRNFTPMINDYGKQYLTPIPSNSGEDRGIGQTTQPDGPHAQKVNKRRATNMPPSNEIPGMSTSGG